MATSLPTLLTLLSLSGYVSALVDDSSPLKYNGPSTAFPRTMSANATSFAIASNSGMQQDMDIIRARRIDAAVGGVISVASISSWYVCVNYAIFHKLIELFTSQAVYARSRRQVAGFGDRLYDRL